MIAPSTKANVDPEPLRPVEASEGLTEFASEQVDSAPLIRAPISSSGDEINGDVVLGLDGPARWPEPRRTLARGAALVGAGLALGAVGIVVLQMLLQPAPNAALAESAPPTNPIVEPPPAPPLLPSPPPTSAPQPSPVAAAAAPAAAAPVPATDESDEQAIERVLDTYRSLFNGLDAKTADRTEDQRISFDSCDIQVDGDQGVATCRGSARYSPRAGRGDPRIEARQWTFDVRHEGSRRWVIARVETQ